MALYRFRQLGVVLLHRRDSLVGVLRTTAAAGAVVDIRKELFVEFRHAVRA